MRTNIVFNYTKLLKHTNGTLNNLLSKMHNNWHAYTLTNQHLLSYKAINKKKKNNNILNDLLCNYNYFFLKQE